MQVEIKKNRFIYLFLDIFIHFKQEYNLVMAEFMDNNYLFYII